MQTGHYDAVRAAHGIDAQASALQAAHYATDPEYAAKIAGIAHAFAGLPPGDTPGTPVTLDPARGALPGVVAAVARFQAARTALVKAQAAYAKQTARDDGTSRVLPADFTAAQTEFASAQDQLSSAARGSPAPGSTVAINSNNTTTVTNNPVTTIHVTAESHDPQAIAQNVNETMDRVYGNMVRYLGAAIA
jgi:flagellum-specific peptidoglycan hydrolase FlgJ